jgi:hypothetical protein
MKSRSFFDGRYGQTNFHSNPTKNAPKCIIFIFENTKFFSGEGTPPPRTPPPQFSRLRCSMGPPRKNPGYGPEMLLVYQTPKSPKLVTRIIFNPHAVIYTTFRPTYIVWHSRSVIIELLFNTSKHNCICVTRNDENSPEI